MNISLIMQVFDKKPLPFWFNCQLHCGLLGIKIKYKNRSSIFETTKRFPKSAKDIFVK